ncbi:MAG TPA: hypothetical protein VK988_22415 [Acidimicrobiales bacterium]|nr:hypothetical protein [Acidimicrobiales bacterium]
MEVDEAKRDVQRFAAAFLEFRSTAATATRNAAAVSKIIRGYVEMFPELRTLVDEDILSLDQERRAGDDAPKGAEAVRLILQQEPDRWFYVSELVDALDSHGWLPDSENPANAVRTALERLINTPDSDVKKDRNSANKVIYSYRPDDAPPLQGYDDEEPF